MSIELSHEAIVQRAANVISEYVHPETLAPNHAVSLQKLIVDKAQAHPRLDARDPRDLELVARSVRKVLAARANDSLTRFDRGRVVLDLQGEHGNMAWTSQEPQIVFCALTSQDSMVEGAEAMALYFDPQLVGQKPVMDRATGQPQVNRDTGEYLTKPDQWAAAGYVAIVKTFDSIAAADEALVDLQSAVRTLATPAPGEEEDETEVEVPEPGADLMAL